MDGHRRIFLVIMKEFFKLIRWTNLLIISITMVLMRYAILEPLLGKTQISLYSLAGSANIMTLQTPWYDFLLLVVATVLIAAGGYVINDYFDIKTDLINRGKVIVGTKVPRRQALMFHNILNITGVATGFYASARTGYLWLGAIFLIVSGLLYFYSASYKRQFLIGNLIVAFLTAMVPMLVVIFEGLVLYQYYAINAVIMPDLSIAFYWVGGFSIFAFVTTLCREIIKDIEDFEGDVAYGRNTVPVVIGILSSKILAVALVVITLLMLFTVWYFFFFDYITLAYISVFIGLPLMYVVYQLMVSQSKKQLHNASNIMKVVMLAGILYSVVVKIMLTYNLV
jgi:4-hydroxybenzoate polyprenyltransferase